MSRLGVYADKINAIREQKGPTPAVFRQDETDLAKGDKEAMEREMYRRTDARLPSGICGRPPADAAQNEGEDG